VVVGVPDISPPAESDKPPGKLPDATLHVTAPVEPSSSSRELNTSPTTGLGKLGVMVIMAKSEVLNELKLGLVTKARLLNW